MCVIFMKNFTNLRLKCVILLINTKLFQTLKSFLLLNTYHTSTTAYLHTIAAMYRYCRQRDIKIIVIERVLSNILQNRPTSMFIKDELRLDMFYKRMLEL